MPNFQIINNSSEITLSNEWISSTKFNSKDRLVDAKGNAISSDYKGRHYRIIEKRERAFSIPERIGRGFLGTLAVVGTLFVALFSKAVRSLFTDHESVRFGILESFKQKTYQAPSAVISPAPKSGEEIKRQQNMLQEKQRLEAQLVAQLDLESKRKAQIDWCERTNKEKEGEYQLELSKLNEKSPDTESGRLVKARRFESLTNNYKRGVEFRKKTLDNYLSGLDSTQNNAKEFALALTPGQHN